MKKTILKRNGEPYLIRYTLFKCKWFSIKIHKIIMDDPADLHDHPWNYLSLILWGGYYEETMTVFKVKDLYTDVIEEIPLYHKHWYGPLSILNRKGDNPHRLILKNKKPCISLVFTSPKYRKWGYVPIN